VRLKPGLPSLRSRRFAREFRRTLAAVAERREFRVVHYSLQRDHVHMLVEADGKDDLGRGMKAVGTRLARAVNRVFGRRGCVLDGRYHLRPLRTPLEVRRALAYVLLNARRHWAKRHGCAPAVRVDEASSGRWFDGWKASGRTDSTGAPPDRREVGCARTWLLRVGWRRHGLIDAAEVPGGAR
jgi:REP element-mobilizing transposase RayT